MNIIISIIVYYKKYNRRTVGVILKIILQKLKEKSKEINQDIFYLIINY
jgi:hypothetical protein